MRLLVTGGAGFIGSNFIHHVLENHPDWLITNYDKLTYAGNLHNLYDVELSPRYRFIRGDIADQRHVDYVLSEGFDVIINFAAESHVDRSIIDCSPFIETNIKGTQVLLDAIRKYPVDRFIQVSTDEVYGSILDGLFVESSPLAPNNPYAASKTAGDLLCLAYYQTYGLPVSITRCSNNYGPYQFPEKLIPLSITNVMEGKQIPVYGDGLNVRDWIYVKDHCRALEMVIEKGKIGEVYNIGASCEKNNLELISNILDLMLKPKNFITFVADRPGHDRRYAIDASKISKQLGWKPIYRFNEALEETVNWYLNNEAWWRRVKQGEYRKKYELAYS